MSETFVYRELLGLRARARRVLPVSVHAPSVATAKSKTLAALAEEARVVYSLSTLRHLPVALMSNRRAFRILLRDCAAADASSLPARLKQFVQGLAGIALGQSLARQDVSHIHAHMANTPATVALYAAQFLNVPFSFTGHAADLFVHRSRLELKLQRAAFVACISKWHAEFYQSVCAGNTAKRPVIRCSVSVPETLPRGTGKGILAVGRLVPKKGFDLLLRAYAKLTSTDAAIEDLMIVGDGPEKRELIRLAQELKISANVSFTGARGHDEVLELVRSCRLFVLPCRMTGSGDRDGIPVVLMEAMAAARPVIAGDLPTIRELIEHEVTGLLVDAEDVHALVEAMQKVLQHTSLAETLGIAGWRHVTSEFSDEVNITRLEGAIGDAAEEYCRWQRV